jgi:serine protease
MKSVNALSITLFAVFTTRVSASDQQLALDIYNSSQPNKVQAIPNFEAKQFHLAPAPIGVNAPYAWEIPGGTGRGVKVVDVERGWNPNHIEFKKPFFAAGTILSGSVDHGTAVWGLVAARRDGVGTTGVAHEADFGYSSYQSGGLQVAIGRALNVLDPGDVLLIEAHDAGPDRGHYAPVEYNKNVFAALQKVVEKGVHCVAVAGNGDSDLDSPLYKKAFDRNYRDSGCILVASAWSPKQKKARSRFSTSNYGSRIDAFAYGESLVTTGYGGTYNGGKDARYSSRFGGTSGATPIVAGVVAAVSGIAKERGIVVTPAEMREAIRNTGTPAAGGDKERIGRLPNIPEILEYLKLN